MSNPSAVTRTAPIAIAPKPPRRQNSYLQEAFTNLELFRGGSMPGREIAESVGSYTTRSLSPCESCQRSRVKCIVSEDEDSCIPCQASGSDCSLLNSPQPRKRKLNGDFDDSGKRRSVCSIFPSSHAFILTPLSYQYSLSHYYYSPPIPPSSLLNHIGESVPLLLSPRQPGSLPLELAFCARLMFLGQPWGHAAVRGARLITNLNL